MDGYDIKFDMSKIMHSDLVDIVFKKLKADPQNMEVCVFMEGNPIKI